MNLARHETKIVRLEPRSDAGRIPPHDLDAEAVCIDALVSRQDKRHDLLAILRQEHFYSDSNGWIFEAVRTLVEADISVEIASVVTWLRDRERLEQIGGASYVLQLVTCTPFAVHAEQQAYTVFDKWRLRQLIATCQKVAAEGYGDVGDTEDFIGVAIASVEEIGHADQDSAAQLVGASVRAAFEQIVAAADRQGMTGWSTGLRSLDRKLGGLQPGRVTVVGARASMGKTALARSIVVAQPAQGVAAAMFSMETTREELALDWAFSLARVDKDKLKEHGGLDDDEWKRITEAATELQRMPIWIDDTPSLSMRKLRAKARQIKAAAQRRGLKLGVVAIDYLQLMDGTEGLAKGANREQEISKLSRAMKVLAGELQIHIVLLSQINRGPEGRQVSNKRPTMAELRESGAIENDADNVILVYRDEYYNHDSTDKGVAELILAKQRGGRRNVTVRVAFADWCTRFDDLQYGQDTSP